MKTVSYKRESHLQQMELWKPALIINIFKYKQVDSSSLLLLSIKTLCWQFVLTFSVLWKTSSEHFGLRGEKERKQLLMIPKLNGFFCLLRPNNLHHFACGQNTTILRFSLQQNIQREKKASFCISAIMWMRLFTFSDEVETHRCPLSGAQR